MKMKRRNFLCTQRLGFFLIILAECKVYFITVRGGIRNFARAFLDFETSIFGDVFIESIKKVEKRWTICNFAFEDFNYLQFLKIFFQRQKNGIAIPKNKNRIIIPISFNS